jgi:hypothetical protein
MSARAAPSGRRSATARTMSRRSKTDSCAVMHSGLRIPRAMRSWSPGAKGHLPWSSPLAQSAVGIDAERDGAGPRAKGASPASRRGRGGSGRLFPDVWLASETVAMLSLE